MGFADLWNAAVKDVVQAVSEGKAEASSAISTAAGIISNAEATGQAVLTTIQKKVMDVISGKVADPVSAIKGAFVSEYNDLRNYLTYFGRVIPAINHRGKTYTWREAQKTPEGMLWFLCAASIADYQRFARALGRDAMALDAYYADAAPDASAGDSGDTGVDTGGTADEGSDSYAVTSDPQAPTGQSHAPPAQSPDVMATVSAIIAAVMKIAKQIIDFVHPPAASSNYTPAPPTPAPAADNTGLFIILAIGAYFLFFGKKKAA